MDDHELNTNLTVPDASKISILAVLVKRMRVLSVLCAASALIAIVNAFIRIESGMSSMGAGTFVAAALAILQAIVYFRPTTELAHIIAQGELDARALMRSIAALAAGLKVVVILIITIAVIVVASTVNSYAYI